MCIPRLLEAVRESMSLNSCSKQSQLNSHGKAVWDDSAGTSEEGVSTAGAGLLLGAFDRSEETSQESVPNNSPGYTVFCAILILGGVGGTDTLMEVFCGMYCMILDWGLAAQRH